jgi:hypothetical protein
MMIMKMSKRKKKCGCVEFLLFPSLHFFSRGIFLIL